MKQEKTPAFIVILFLDTFACEVVEALVRCVEKAFGFRVRALTIHDSTIQTRQPVLDNGSRRHDSHRIMRWLASMAPRHWVKVLAVTSKDLNSPIFAGIFGEAQLGGRFAVMSSYRLETRGRDGIAPSVFIQRVSKEAIHELGHCFGLQHCLDPTCVMSLCLTTQEIDTRGRSFCPACHELLTESLRSMPSHPRA